MTSARILRILVVALTIGSGYDQTPEIEPDAAPLEALAGDEQRLSWANAQFAAAGLQINNVDVVFAADSAVCSDYLGLHSMVGDTHLVRVCDPSVNRRKHTLLHELAHVWIAENVNHQTRSEFMELRDVSVWHDGVTPWRDRGTEHAAEVLAWGIGDQPCWLRPSLNHGDDDAAYTEALAVLTDAAPRCDASSVKPKPQKRIQVIA